MKTKNDPYGLKCKINPKIFFRLRGSQKGGVGGGSAIWEKFPKNTVFLFGKPPLSVGAQGGGVKKAFFYFSYVQIYFCTRLAMIKYFMYSVNENTLLLLPPPYLTSRRAVEGKHGKGEIIVKYF